MLDLLETQPGQFLLCSLRSEACAGTASNSDTRARKTRKTCPLVSNVFKPSGRNARSLPHTQRRDAAWNFDPAYCRICECYPDGTVTAVDPTSIERPRQVAFPACSMGGAVGGAGPT
jgi:hypothetical protein